MNKRLKTWIPLLFILLIVMGCQSEKPQTGGSSQAVIAKRNVRVAQVEKKDIAVILNTSGRIEAAEYININPSLPAKIEKINFKEGDAVKEGDVILEFQNTQLVQAEQQYLNLERNLSRSKELYESNVIDLKTFEEISMGFEIAKANYEFVKENIIVKAPFDGKIAVIALKEGEAYTPMTQQALVRLIAPGRTYIKTYLSDRDYIKAKIGATARVKVDTYPDKVFTGKINFISPEADMMSGRFLCEVLVNEQNNLLKHNQYAKIDIELQNSRNTLVIPKTALINGKHVFVVENGYSQLREIKIGLINNDELEILSGLKQGEAVITTGNIGLINNYPVHIVEQI
ncbi:MAG: efflux RND transporter periplasmic adaptor subunit [Candidatus Cloacimonas sp.]|nr:efflux RND transporter periplasmic adaptor subunit [Candidatus Cloacimonadota bacterium]